MVDKSLMESIRRDIVMGTRAAMLKHDKVQKSHVRGHWRRTESGRRVWVKDYTNKVVGQDKPTSLRGIAHKNAQEAMKRKQVPAEMKSEAPRAVQLTVNTDPQRMWRMQAAQASKDELLFVGIREAFQNGLDAMFEAMGKGDIGHGEFRVDYDREAGTLTISDNGTGMDWDTCLDKFLTLGASGKEAEEGAIGGFGVAKAYILGMVDKDGRWTIRSDDFEASSDQIGQPPTTGLEKAKGVTISFQGIESKLFRWDLKTKLETLFKYTDTGGKVDVYLNGERVEPVEMKPEWEKKIDSSVEIPEGLTMGCHLVPTETSPLEMVRLISPKHGYAMVQLANQTWEVPAHVVTDITSHIRPGNPGYPFDMARLALVGPPGQIHRGIVEGIRTDPASATIKHEYKTEVFGGEGERIFEAQERAAEKAINSDAGLEDAVAEIADIVNNSAEIPAPTLSGADITDPDVREELKRRLVQMLTGGAEDNTGETAFGRGIIPLATAVQIAKEDKAAGLLKESPIGKAFVSKLANGYQKAERFKLTGEHLRQLVAWDAICRVICGQLVKSGQLEASRALDWKPGFVVKGDVKGMMTVENYEPDVARALGKSQERLILFNPLQIQGETPEQKAMSLRDLACHEITHFFASWHNENFTSAEALVQEASLPAIGEILRIGQAAFTKKGKAKAKVDKPATTTVARPVARRRKQTPGQILQGRLELSLRRLMEGRR